jgi:GNAT superfamily N-acetyltransferase
MRAACIDSMRASGIDQWDDLYPTADLFHRDCIENNLFALRDDRMRLVGCAALDQRQEPEYSEVDWLFKPERIGVVHRLMLSPEHQGNGYAKVLMRGIEQEATLRSYQAIRLDAYLHNPPALRLYAGLRYRSAGQVQFRTGPFECFEKQI